MRTRRPGPLDDGGGLKKKIKSNKKAFRASCFALAAGGFEPPTLGLWIPCSNQLSYTALSCLQTTSYTNFVHKAIKNQDRYSKNSRIHYIKQVNIAKKNRAKFIILKRKNLRSKSIFKCSIYNFWRIGIIKVVNCPFSASKTRSGVNTFRKF